MRRFIKAKWGRFRAWLLKRPLQGRLFDEAGSVVAEAVGDTRHGITFNIEKSATVTRYSLRDADGKLVADRVIGGIGPGESLDGLKLDLP